MPIGTQNPEEKFIPTGERNRKPDTSSTDVAVAERWLDFPDGRMRYLQAGSGPPLILLHGLMGYSFSWRFTIPALTPHATVYAVDNLGAGFSPARDGMDCSLHATAERVLQFADALGIRDFDLLGTSYGGGVAVMVAAICAERQKELRPTDLRPAELRPTRLRPAKSRSTRFNDTRLQRLVLVAPINPWSPHGKRLAPFLAGPAGSLLFRNTIERWRSLDYLWLRRLFADGAKIPPDSLQGYRMPVIKNHAFRHAAQILKNWTADLAELEAALPKIRDYPTLLMWGTRDRAVDFRSAERLSRNFRNVERVALEGVGHLPYEEAPEDFNRALIEFLINSQVSVQNSGLD